MVTPEIKANSYSLEKELQWFTSVLETRMNLYFNKDGNYASIEEVPVPEHQAADSHFAGFILEHKLEFASRLVLALSLAPHIRPQLLDIFYTRNATYDRFFSEFGGVSDSAERLFIPTVATALFILAGGDLEKTIAYHSLFHPEHPLIRENIIQLKAPENPDTFFQTRLHLSAEWLQWITTGKSYRPFFSSQFPARYIGTELDFDRDLVLNPHTMQQVEEILCWIEYGEKVYTDYGLNERIKPGYRSFFYGPPGTGKTFTATLLGKKTGRDVYKIDLSMVVSKYIGETEKNLEKVFSLAEHKQWILFFDEADALFGKRTEINTSNDRFANQEVSYLLQRVEDFPGVVILSSNLRTNLDVAFIRRFQSLIYFPMPDCAEREILWKLGLPASICPDEEVIAQIAARFELSGGSIMNVIGSVLLKFAGQRMEKIREKDIIEGIKRELRKEGKMFEG